MISGLNGIKIPSWVPKLGGKGINLPKIQMLARGTDNWSGGIAQVHEKRRRDHRSSERDACIST